MGREFLGCYDLIHDPGWSSHGPRADRNRVAESIKIAGLDDPKLAQHRVPAALLEKFREEIDDGRAELLPPFDHAAFLEGSLTPIWFGSAIKFLRREGADGRHRRIRAAAAGAARRTRQVAPEESKVSGFVFKVQANMDPKHRDRVAFVRLVSGHFTRGMKLTHVRSKKTPWRSRTRVMFLASDRELPRRPGPATSIGIPNHGQLRIGDATDRGRGPALHPASPPSRPSFCRAAARATR